MASIRKLVSRVRRWKPDEEPHKTMVDLDFTSAFFIIMLMGVVPIALGAELFRLAGLWGFLFGEFGLLLLVSSVIYYGYGDERPKRQ